MTRDRLLKLLHYNPGTGDWTWLVGSRNTEIGQLAGTINAQGYRVITITERKLRAHRLAWLYMTGQYPSGQLDHIDGNRANNRWNNLREATPSQNCFNNHVARGLSGYKGVRRSNGGPKWQAIIAKNGKQTHLGCFVTKEDAARAYNKAASELFGEYAMLNEVS